MDRDPAQRHSSVPSSRHGGGRTAFASILFSDGPAPRDRGAPEPDFFADLHLDRVVAAITAGRESYGLTDFFHMPLAEVDAVVFRQEVMRDLEDRGLRAELGAFAETMRTVRAHLARAERAPHRAEHQRWFLEAAAVYGDGIIRLAEDLARAPLTSRGLVAFRGHVTRYVASNGFRSLVTEAKEVRSGLGVIRYRLGIFPLRVEVHPFDGGSDYGEEIGALFARFRQGGVEPYVFDSGEGASLSNVEAMILERITRIFPDAFARLATFNEQNQVFIEPAIETFDREIQFYIACCDYFERFRSAGLSLCYPTVSRESKEAHGRGVFDLNLAEVLIGEHRSVVTNDFDLSGAERMIVVTGPNRGGKTTFARALGQIHYLASLGCPVPGREARLPLCDRIFTHFEREEDVADLRGRLKDDLIRMRAVLDAVTPRSLVVVNEMFSSTTLKDATDLSRKIAESIMRRDASCVWVTFVEELAALDERTVSMVATAKPDHPSERTFRVVRRPADGLAYAKVIAERHRLTREAIDERLKP